MVRRLLLVTLAAWILRWAVLEVAAYASRHWVRQRPPTSSRAPGRMPGPLD
jgi:hypothetical protein